MVSHSFTSSSKTKLATAKVIPKHAKVPTQYDREQGTFVCKLELQLQNGC
jgi:hypothetical protein